jgi:hypothetical protein
MSDTQLILLAAFTLFLNFDKIKTAHAGCLNRIKEYTLNLSCMAYNTNLPSGLLIAAIKAGDIAQGTFTYTLEVNNQQVDSKKMILAKD